MKFGPEDCIITQTCFYAGIDHVRDIKGKINPILFVRVASCLELEPINFAYRMTDLFDKLRILMNNISGDHMFETNEKGEVKKTWDSTSKGMLQPCLALNGCSLVNFKLNTGLHTFVFSHDKDARENDLEVILEKEFLVNNRVPSFLDSIKVTEINEVNKKEFDLSIEWHSFELSSHELSNNFNGINAIIEKFLSKNFKSKSQILLKYLIPNLDSFQN